MYCSSWGYKSRLCMTHLSAWWLLTDRFCLLPVSVLLKFPSAFIFGPSKVILRFASAALAGPHAILPPPAFLGRKKHTAAEALSSPYFSIVCTPTLTSIHRHASTHRLTYTLVQRNTTRWTGENLSSPTRTRCLNLLRLMFCVDLQW